MDFRPIIFIVFCAVTIGVAAGSVVKDQWNNNKFLAVMAALSFLFAVLLVVGMPAQMQMDDDAGYISHFQLMLDEQMTSARPDHKLMAHYIFQIHKLHKIDDFVARLRFPPHFGR